MKSTIPAPNIRRTHSARRSVRTLTPLVRDRDKQRSALALRLTLRLSGLNEKQAASALRLERSTINRRVRGEIEAPEARHFREYLRKLVDGGTFPVAVLADAAAEVWGASVEGWTADEIRDRKRDLHRAEETVNHRVNLWQMDDLQGLPAVCEDAIDEALLEQATRTIELYALRQELRIRRLS